MRLVVDADRCRGHRRGCDSAPDVIGSDDRGHAVLVDPNGEVAHAHETAARKAVGT